MSENIDIFQSYTFSEKKIKSAYDYLWGLKSGLISKTRAELTIDVEAYSIVNPNFTNSAGYVLYIVAPKLGNFKRKILSVVEDYNTGYYPVVVTNEFTNETYENVSETQFLDIVQKVILQPLVKKFIEELYQMSKEHK